MNDKKIFELTGINAIKEIEFEVISNDYAVDSSRHYSKFISQRV